MELTESDINDNRKENLGWADAMTQILKTRTEKKKRKTIILSKAKKLPIKKESDEGNNEKGKDEEKNLKKVDWTSKGRLKPNVLEKDREKRLSKIAVRGIVQLFNAVKQQQKKLNLASEKPKTNQPNEKTIINKSDFLTILQNGPSSLKVSNVAEDIKEGSKMSDENVDDKEMWSVLRDNFIQNSKSKNWDEIEAF